MHKTYPATMAHDKSEYVGNQQYAGSGVQRFCPICQCHRTIGEGSVQRVQGIKQWVCVRHPKVKVAA